MTHEPCTCQITSSGRLMEAAVVSHEHLCQGHRRLVLALPPLRDACPGQFLHLGQPSDNQAARSRPFLRRAFSIGGLRARGKTCEADIIYRIHGAGTQWMASLCVGDRVSALGPLGHGFEINPAKTVAWLVAGGVGLPPVLWLAERLQEAGKSAVAFFGARVQHLMPLKIGNPDNLPRDGSSAALAAELLNPGRNRR